MSENQNQNQRKQELSLMAGMFLVWTVFYIMIICCEGVSRTVCSRWTKSYSLLSKGNLLEIPTKFIRDPMVLTWLSEAQKLDNFKKALRLMFIDSESSDTAEGTDKIEQLAAQLYNQLHSRFVISDDGLSQVKEKYVKGFYGKCPRVYCDNHIMLPVGLHDRPGVSTAKCFCPKCRDVYEPTTHLHLIDGTAFGRSLPHLFLQKYPELCPQMPQDHYIPTIFGFRVNKNSPEQKIYRGDLEQKDSSSS
jgi:casein kinase II subunit beta